MQANIPTWILIFQALATPMLAILAIFIAYMQWYTAHRKIVTDMFDKRIAICTNIRNVVAKIVTSGNCTSQDLFDFDLGVDQARFLFGRSVRNYIENLRHNVISFSHHNQLMSSGEIDQKDRDAHILARSKFFGLIKGFYREAPPLFQPYILLDQKIPMFWLARIGRKNTE